MWFALAAGAVLAASPPGLDLNDLDLWEASAAQVLDGPDGCWELVGRASWNWDIGRWGSSRGDALFVGRLVDGVWQGVHLEPLGEVMREGRSSETWVYSRDEARFAPLVGALQDGRVTVSVGSSGPAPDDETEEEDREANTSNLLRSALERMSGDAEYAYLEWDDDAGAVKLLRVLPMGDRNNAPAAEAITTFPGGKRPGSRLDVIFPPSFYAGTLPRYRVRDAEVHVRGQVARGMVFPESETFRFDFGVLGFKFSGAQTIRYKSAHRCATADASTSTD